MPLDRITRGRRRRAAPSRQPRRDSGAPALPEKGLAPAQDAPKFLDPELLTNEATQAPARASNVAVRSMLPELRRTDE
jgi:hypothetical protein